MYKKFSILYLLVFFITPNLKSQLTPALALTKLYIDFPQEKIYLWTNKSGYIAGETIWFKAYVFSGYDLSNISSNLYVEFINKEKNQVTLKRYPLLKGTAYGSIALDTTIFEDVYYIRAFTDWMLNFDERFQYFKQVPVYNPSSKFKLDIAKDQWEIKANPEGGSLIEGIATKISVRFISPGLYHPAWTGYVANEEGVRVTSLDVLDENVATFNIIPEHNKKYRIVVTTNEGSTKTISLPEAKLSGAQISTTYKGNDVAIDLNFRNIDSKGYTLIGQIQNQLVYQAEIKSSSSIIHQSINTKDYLNGVLQLTLFDPNNKPVSERLVFLNPDKLIYDTTIQINTIFDSSPRSMNEVALSIDSTNWNSYAVTILDDELPDPKNDENLLSSLWLTADLLTPLHDVSQYFENPDQQNINKLDAILISEIWKRFDWENTLAGKFPGIKYKPQNYLTFNGLVESKKDIPPHSGVSLLLGNPGAPSQIVYTETDSINKISIDNIIFAKEFYGFYRLNNGRKYQGRKIDIDFTRTDVYEPVKNILPPTGYSLTLNEKKEEEPGWVKHEFGVLNAKKANDSRYKILQEVIVRSAKKTKTEELHDKLTTGRFKISNDYIFDFVNEKQNALVVPSIFHWLQQRVSGLDVILDRETQDWIPVIRGHGVSRLRANVLLYLNEGETTPTWLNLLPADNIIMIKVITTPRTFAFGNNVGMVISVYTERDSIVAAQSSEEFRNKLLKGYDENTVYTIPQYDNKELAFPEADARAELLWQPVIPPTDSLYHSKIKFFNNDSVKKLRIIIQGFNKDGFPVYINKVITSDAIKAF